MSQAEIDALAERLVREYLAARPTRVASLDDPMTEASPAVTADDVRRVLAGGAA